MDTTLIAYLDGICKRIDLYEDIPISVVIQELDINRQTYKSRNVNWGGSDPTMAQYSRGTTDFQVSMTETHVINTGFINQPDFMFLEELWTSNEVYEITDNGGLRPINVVNVDFIRKNKGNREITNLELTYVYSNNITLISK